jgi:hypothetical protein
LWFIDNIATQLSKLSQPYKMSRRLITQGLGDLNDHLFPLISTVIDGGQIAKVFNAKSAFEISPESPLTHQNMRAMRERDVMFGNVKVRCEWHLKLFPVRDRIHFHFGVPAVMRDKILIGIFTEHLST